MALERGFRALDLLADPVVAICREDAVEGRDVDAQPVPDLRIDIVAPACGLSCSTKISYIRAMTDAVRLEEKTHADC